MSAILAQFLATFLQSLVQSVGAWFNGQQGIADQSQAKTLAAQLDSEKRARAAEAANAKAVAAAKAPLTPAEWNAGRVPLLLLLGLLCWGSGGCALFTRYVYVPAAVPLVHREPRPAIPADPAEFTPREQILVGYAARLEAAIDDYNAAAAAQNAANGY